MSLARNKIHALGLAVLMAIGAQVVSATYAHADEPETPKEIFDRGMFHYNLGEFETALEYFTKGYELEPLSDLLFNIGQCHRNMKEYERAVFFFERYLAGLSSPAEQKRINKLLDELRPLVPTTRSSTVAAAPAPVPESSSDSTALAVSPPETEDDSIVEEWWFWALIVGAVGATAAAVAVSQSGGTEPMVMPPDGAIVFDFRGL